MGAGVNRRTVREPIDTNLSRMKRLCGDNLDAHSTSILDNNFISFGVAH